MLFVLNFSKLNPKMFLSLITHTPRPHFSLRLITLAAAGMVATSFAALAQGTHLWTQSRLEEFEKGTPQGVELTSDGHLREGPSLIDERTTPSTYVWSVAAGSNGAAYLGTGTPATVLRVESDSKIFTLFETKDLAVQVVRLGPDGALYAATLPSGKVYRLKPDATTKQDETDAAVVFDLAKVDNAAGVKGAAAEKGSERPEAATSHYIWDLTFDAAGRLYIATGGPGAIYRVDIKTDARPEPFFKSDEEHIRSLAWDARGNLIAGTEGSGLVYRISPEGKGYVLFEAPRREITSVAVAANGTIYAASVGDKSHNPLPPLPVQGVSAVSITIVQPGSMQAANSSASVPEGSEIYALTEGQAPRKLWSGKDEVVYALSAQAGGLVALSGNRGRVFKIADDGSYADVAHIEAQQGLSLAEVRGAQGTSGILIGTGNTGKLVTLKADLKSKHEYASDVLDTGALARFGRVEVEPDSANYELLTRTGNVEQPVRGWTEWQPLKDRGVVSAAGRYLQWRAVLHAHGLLGAVGVNYLPVNAAPVVDDLVVVPGARINPQAVAQPNGQPPIVNIAFPSANQNAAVSFDGGSAAPLQALKDRTAVTVRWAAHDDNGDDLTYSLYIRGDGESLWRLLKAEITDKAYSFDAALIPDGGYQIKVVASDAPSHTPVEALTGEKISERFEVDTTPPVVNGLRAGPGTMECTVACVEEFQLSFDAEDAFSPIAHAEYSLDAGPWQYIEPAGGISDSRHEHYDMRLSAVATNGKMVEHLVTVRVYDRHENVGVGKAVIPAQAK
jgi:sugar lactone lactonase YvrE